MVPADSNFEPSRCDSHSRITIKKKGKSKKQDGLPTIAVSMEKKSCALESMFEISQSHDAIFILSHRYLLLHLHHQQVHHGLGLPMTHRECSTQSRPPYHQRDGASCGQEPGGVFPGSWAFERDNEKYAGHADEGQRTVRGGWRMAEAP